MIYGGIDGCKYGWILIISDNGNIFFGGLYKTINELLEKNNLDIVLIDMPIGLSSKKRLRTLDSLLRKELKGRASTVFNAPCRESLIAVDYSTASEINYEVEGKKISKQTYFISPKIKELDNLLIDQVDLRDVFIESHPELCFKYLNKETILENKSTEQGIKKRLEVLKNYYSDSERLFLEILASTKRKDVKKDDILDAICLCTVNQFSGEEEMSFINDKIIMDEKGIRMRIGFFNPNK